MGTEGFCGDHNITQALAFKVKRATHLAARVALKNLLNILTVGRISLIQGMLLKVARSSLYYKRTGESVTNLTLMQEIDRAFTEWPFLGVRQMCRYLVSLGYGAGRKRVRRLMRLMGLMAYLSLC